MTETCAQDSTLGPVELHSENIVLDFQGWASRAFVGHRNTAFNPREPKVVRWVSRSAGSDESPEVTVIIPTLDGKRGGCLPALLRQFTEQTYRQFEILIVEGDSRQGRAINLGAALARGRFLLTCDDDTRLMCRSAIERLVRVLGKNPCIGIAGGINIIPDDASAFVSRVMREIPRRSTPQVAVVTESDLAEHPLLMIRRDVFMRVGGENEMIPRGLDPYLRSVVRRAGYKVVVVPGAYYAHLPPPNLFRLARQFFRNGRHAAFCSRFYPQWLIETPSQHVSEFVERRPFPYRVGRFIWGLVINALKGRLLYLVSHLAYAAGFGWGYLLAEKPGPV